jgi:hypothetical protein
VRIEQGAVLGRQVSRRFHFSQEQEELSCLYIFSVFETWWLTIREELRVFVFENKVLRRIFGHKRDEVTRRWINCIIRSFVICTHLLVL